MTLHPRWQECAFDFTKSWSTLSSESVGRWFDYPNFDDLEVHYPFSFKPEPNFKYNTRRAGRSSPNPELSAIHSPRGSQDPVVTFRMINQQLQHALAPFRDGSEMKRIPGEDKSMTFAGKEEVEDCYRSLVDMHDVFYVQMALLVNVGVKTSVSKTSSSSKTLANAEEIIVACRRGKTFLQTKYAQLDIKFNDIEHSVRTSRPKKHPYNLLQLAHTQGRLDLPDIDSLERSMPLTPGSVRNGRNAE